MHTAAAPDRPRSRGSERGGAGTVPKTPRPLPLAALLWINHLRDAAAHVREALVQLDAVATAPEVDDDPPLYVAVDDEEDPALDAVHEARRVLRPLPEQLVDLREDLARRHRIASKEYMAPERWVRG